MILIHSKSDLWEYISNLSYYKNITLHSFNQYWQWDDYLSKPFHPFENESMKVQRWLLPISQGMPLAYLVKMAPFFKQHFYVDERVLIPRPESELLLEMVLTQVKLALKNSSSSPAKPFVVTEVGIGSGALLASLIYECQAFEDLYYQGTDLSEKALEVASINFHRKRISQKKYHLIHTDMLNHVEIPSDIIFSNPPYIIKEQSTATEQVALWEPAMALFLGQDEYQSWMIRLINQAMSKLKPNGFFFMEGHEDQLPSLAQIVTHQGLKNSLHKDYNNQYRFIVIEKT